MNHTSINPSFQLKVNFVDLGSKCIFPALVGIVEGKIDFVQRLGDEVDEKLPYMSLGFIDAHVHIESSMLIPSEFARLAVTHGSIATVSDPHEIANVCGVEGVNFMIEDAAKVPFHFFFGAPSCVPATSFETAGSSLDALDVRDLLARDDIWYLSEMMNFPGVIHDDVEVLDKIAFAKSSGKPVDGHAPGLRGEHLVKYISAGISTDHECFTMEEALEKLQLGMKVIIREGSVAKNFDSLIPLMSEWSSEMMFCSDDKHPDSLVAGHINQLCARAKDYGVDLFKVLQVACLNPIDHYKLPLSRLRIGDRADFILLKDLISFEVEATYIGGEMMALAGRSFLQSVDHAQPINRFECSKISMKDLEITVDELPITNGLIPVIEALDGQLITNMIELSPSIEGHFIVSDPQRDLLKIVVVNRYQSRPVAKAFIRNFGIQAGAIASSVAHDSHNIVAVGDNDAAIAEAINLIIAGKGGISCVSQYKSELLPLPIGGLMSANDAYAVAEAYANLDAAAKSLGSNLKAPFMTLSFMALLVIPHLKISDQGLFDGDQFRLITKVH